MYFSLKMVRDDIVSGLLFPLRALQAGAMSTYKENHWMLPLFTEANASKPRPQFPLADRPFSPMPAAPNEIEFAMKL